MMAKLKWPVTLITPQDYKALPSVVLVRDCWYGEGTIAIIVGDLDLLPDIIRFVREHKAVNLVVHIESVHGYNKVHIVFYRG